MGFITLQIPQLGQSDATEEAKVVSDFTAIQALLNGGLDVANLAPASNVAYANLAAAVQQLLFSAGDVKTTAKATADTGWLMCDGSAISRSTYGTLFTAIGTTYGAGDGVTTFGLPDLRGRGPLGADNMGTAAGAAGRLPNSNRALGQTGGAEQHQHTGNIPGHTHTIAGETSTSAGSFAGGGITVDRPVNLHAHGGATGGPSATAFTTALVTGLDPYQVLSYVIKT